jgi:hypothetical protein
MQLVVFKLQKKIKKKNSLIQVLKASSSKDEAKDWLIYYGIIAQL